MKITDVRSHLVNDGRRNYQFVTVHTADGHCGIGEAGLSGRELAVAGAIEHFKPLLIGADAARVEHLWQVMFRGGFFPAQRVQGAAIAAIDLALWDLRGKRLGVAVYELLGGTVREYIPAYTALKGPDRVAAAKEALDLGWRAVRWELAASEHGVMRPSEAIKQAVREVAEIRSEIGDGIELIIDAHTRLRPREAIALCRELEPYRPFFVEDPLRVENLESYRHLRQHTPVPIAAGEQMASKWEFKTLLNDQLIDIARIDLCIAGGLTEAVKIAAACETNQVDIAVHNPLGPVSTAACAHFSIAMTPSIIQEQPSMPGETLTDIFPEQPVRFDNGNLHLTGAPGLGVTFDPEAAAKHPYQEWTVPQLRRPDGSYTNW